MTEFKEKLKKEILKEKLATDKTDIIRDLQDIPRILKDLYLISDWESVGLMHRYTINWKRVLSIIKERD